LSIVIANRRHQPSPSSFNVSIAVNSHRQPPTVAISRQSPPTNSHRHRQPSTVTVTVTVSPQRQLSSTVNRHHQPSSPTVNVNRQRQPSTINRQ
jgi:hypothetical protein